MYEITIRKRFAAAHRLVGYGGRCEALHGHNFRVEVGAQGAELDDVGLLLDFKVLKRIVAEVLDRLDHSFLNDHEYFTKNNPSSELIARYLHDEVSRQLPTPGVIVSFVRVWESEDAYATYRPDR